jgi:broad specificity phosphatase PhoE
MSRLYMIRHGKPAATWGQSADLDPGLDELGDEQARGARDALMALADPPTRVVSSPLRRCRETAEPFARALSVPVEIDDTFGEIPTPSAVPLAERPGWLRRAFGGRWSEIIGELDYDAWRRAVGEGLLRYSGAAVFSHYVAINAAVSCVTGSDRVLSFRPDHCSITSFAVREGRLKLIDYGRQAETQIL